MAGARRVMRIGDRQGGGVWERSSGVVLETDLVGSEFSEGMPTHAHITTLFEHLLVKPLGAKILNEPAIFNTAICGGIGGWALRCSKRVMSFFFLGWRGVETGIPN